MNNRQRHLCLSLSLIILYCFAFVACDTANSLENPDKYYFVRYFGHDGDQSAVDLIRQGDGNIFLLGNSKTSDVGLNRIILMKITPDGTPVKTYFIGEPGDIAKDIQMTNDNNFIVLCDHPAGLENIDFKLIRIDGSLNKIDSVVFGSLGVENSKTVTPLIDGGFIVTGTTEYDTSVVIDPTRPDDQSDIFHFRCNNQLDFDGFIWEGQFGPGTIDEGIKVFQSSDTVFYVFGSTNQFHDENDEDMVNLIYYSINDVGANGPPGYLGNYQNNTSASHVLKVPDGLGSGYLVVGTESTNGGDVNMRVAKLRSSLVINSADDTEFDKPIDVDGRRISGVSSVALLNGLDGYLLLGNEERESGNNNIWLTKIDLAGNEIWSASYGSEEDNDIAAAAVELEDGRLLVAGTVRLINNQSKIVLMKLNSSGRLIE